MRPELELMVKYLEPVNMTWLQKLNFSSRYC